MATGWYLIDPLIGLLVAAVIVWSTWGLLRDSLRLSLDGDSRGDRLRRGLPHGGVAAGCERGAPSPRLGAQCD